MRLKKYGVVFSIVVCLVFGSNERGIASEKFTIGMLKALGSKSLRALGENGFGYEYSNNENGVKSVLNFRVDKSNVVKFESKISGDGGYESGFYYSDSYVYLPNTEQVRGEFNSDIKEALESIDAANNAEWLRSSDSQGVSYIIDNFYLDFPSMMLSYTGKLQGSVTGLKEVKGRSGSVITYIFKPSDGELKGRSIKVELSVKSGLITDMVLRLSNGNFESISFFKVKDKVFIPLNYFDLDSLRDNESFSITLLDRRALEFNELLSEKGRSYSYITNKSEIGVDEWSLAVNDLLEEIEFVSAGRYDGGLELTLRSLWGVERSYCFIMSVSDSLVGDGSCIEYGLSTTGF